MPSRGVVLMYGEGCVDDDDEGEDEWLPAGEAVWLRYAIGEVWC